MTESAFREHSKLMYDAWNRQDVEAVLDRYTPDVIYRDPNTRGAVQGREAMRRYLTRGQGQAERGLLRPGRAGRVLGRCVVVSQ